MIINRNGWICPWGHSGTLHVIRGTQSIWARRNQSVCCVDKIKSDKEGDQDDGEKIIVVATRNKSARGNNEVHVLRDARQGLSPLVSLAAKKIQARKRERWGDRGVPACQRRPLPFLAVHRVKCDNVRSRNGIAALFFSHQTNQACAWQIPYILWGIFCSRSSFGGVLVGWWQVLGGVMGTECCWYWSALPDRTEWGSFALPWEMANW